jgi:hypothetical protein
MVYILTLICCQQVAIALAHFFYHDGGFWFGRYVVSGKMMYQRDALKVIFTLADRFSLHVSGALCTHHQENNQALQLLQLLRVFSVKTWGLVVG